MDVLQLTDKPTYINEKHVPVIECITVAQSNHDDSTSTLLDLTFETSDPMLMGYKFRNNSSVKNCSTPLEATIRVFDAIVDPSKVWHHYYQWHVQLKNDFPALFLNGTRNDHLTNYKTYVAFDTPHYRSFETKDFGLGLLSYMDLLRLSSKNVCYMVADYMQEQHVEKSLQILQAVGITPDKLPAWSDTADSPVWQAVLMATSLPKKDAFFVMANIAHMIAPSLPIRTSNVLLNLRDLPSLASDTYRVAISDCSFDHVFRVIDVKQDTPGQELVFAIAKWFVAIPFVDTIQIGSANNPVGVFYKRMWPSREEEMPLLDMRNSEAVIYAIDRLRAIIARFQLWGKNELYGGCSAYKNLCEDKDWAKHCIFYVSPTSFLFGKAFYGMKREGGSPYRSIY